MPGLTHRPVLVAALGLAFGTWLAAVQDGSAWPIPALLAVLGLVAFARLRRNPRWATLALAATFAGLGALLWIARHGGPPADPLARWAATHPETTRYTIEGRVAQAGLLTPDETYVSLVVDVDSVGARDASIDAPGRVLVRWSEPTFAAHPGDRVAAEGLLSVALGPVNPDTPSVEDYYRRNGVHSVMRVRSGHGVERIVPAPAHAPRAMMSRLRTHLAARLKRVVPDDSEAFLLRVWLGERGSIDDATYRTFLESGTAHILAVSGLHTGIVFVTLNELLKILTRRKRVRVAIILVAVLAFALLTGARVSSVRAAIMIALYLSASWFDREPDAPTALGLAGAVFILHRPDVMFDTAFQLSFLSVASILLFADRLGSLFVSLPQRLRGAVGATLAVQILPLPVAITAFHVFPLAAVLVNLMVIPLLSVILMLGLLTSALALVAPPIAVLTGAALHVPIQAIERIASAVASADISHRYVTTPTGIAMGCYWAAALLGWYTLGARRARALLGTATALLFLLSAAFWRPWSQPPEVTALDVGHGDGTFVRTPGGGTIVVDAGDRGEYQDMGRRVIAPFLWSNHETHIDALVISHADRDHIGGAAYLVRHFPVGSVLLGPKVFETDLEQELIDVCDMYGVPITRVAAGHSLALRGARIDVLHPPEAWPLAVGRNDSSLVLRVAWDDFSVLLPGDIEYPGEFAVAARSPKATVLKVPHHGSDTSSSPEFLDAVDPEIALISSGSRQGGSVLDPGVVRRYRERGIAVYRTDVVGGIRVRPQEGSLTVATARGRRGYVTRTTDP